jgi:hypothetical protein
MNDSFIGDSAVKAAHAINIERGWELPVIQLLCLQSEIPMSR